MKKMLSYLFLILISLQLVACGSTYKVATSTGDVFYADGRPDVDSDTNQLVFTDQYGKEIILEREKVDYIQEADIPKK